MADVDQVEVDAFLLEDADLLLANPVRGPGMGADADAGGVAGTGGSAEHDFLVVGHAAPVTGYLDDAGLHAGVFDALLYLLDEQFGDPVNRSAPEDARHGQVVAGAGDDVNAGAPADFHHHRNVPSQIKGGNVDDRPHAALVCLRKGCRRGIGDGLPVLKTRVGSSGAGSPQGDMLVAEGEAQVGGINRAEYCIDW